MLFKSFRWIFHLQVQPSHSSSSTKDQPPTPIGWAHKHTTKKIYHLKRESLQKP